MDLSDNEWDYLKQYLPEDPVRADRKGRPWTDRRKTLDGIFWVLRTGAPWKDLPERHGSHTTVHRRFQKWREDGIIERILLAIAQDVKAVGKLDLRECFIDGTFVPPKKKGLLCRADKARYRDQDHGDGRLSWSSNRR